MKPKNTFDILLIEDNRADILVVSEALKLINTEYKLTIYRDGEEAINYFKTVVDNAKLPGLVFLDLNLPNFNGFELLRVLRKNRKFSDVPVVVLTSSKYEEDVRLSYRLEANAVIFKPDTLHEYSYLLDSAINFWSK